jgi:hypothetical protein
MMLILIKKKRYMSNQQIIQVVQIVIYHYKKKINITFMRIMIGSKKNWCSLIMKLNKVQLVLS